MPPESVVVESAALAEFLWCHGSEEHAERNVQLPKGGELWRRQLCVPLEPIRRIGRAPSGSSSTGQQEFPWRTQGRES